MKERGLTLLEVLVAAGISIIVGGLLLVIMVNSAGLFTRESSKLEEGLNINDVLMQVRSNIKEASSITASYLSEGTNYTSGPTQLILNLPSLDNSNNIISGSFDTYIYFLDTNQFRFKSFPTAVSSRKIQDQIFSTLVDSLKFQYFDSTGQEITPTSAVKVRITITLKRKTSVNTYETNTATSEASLRND